jgi:hypothetical protein
LAFPFENLRLPLFIENGKNIDFDLFKEVITSILKKPS